MHDKLQVYFVAAAWCGLFILLFSLDDGTKILSQRESPTIGVNKPLTASAIRTPPPTSPNPAAGASVRLRIDQRPPHLPLQGTKEDGLKDLPNHIAGGQ